MFVFVMNISNFKVDGGLESVTSVGLLLLLLW